VSAACRTVAQERKGRSMFLAMKKRVNWKERILGQDAINRRPIRVREKKKKGRHGGTSMTSIFPPRKRGGKKSVIPANAKKKESEKSGLGGKSDLRLKERDETQLFRLAITGPAFDGKGGGCESN